MQIPDLKHDKLGYKGGCGESSCDGSQSFPLGVNKRADRVKGGRFLTPVPRLLLDEQPSRVVDPVQVLTPCLAG
jgi:hypothetical protein